MEPVVAQAAAPVEPLVVIERIARGGEVVERWRQSIDRGEEVKVGRGYDCEVLLDDPHVAALHLHVQRDADGVLWILDAGTRNGLRDIDAGHRVSRLQVAGVHRVQIGHTRLRVIDGTPVVEPERLLPAAAPGWLACIGWLSLAVVLGILSDWLGMTAEIEVTALTNGAVLGTVLTVVWAFAWSLATRLFAGELRFLRHLRVAAMVSALATVLMLAVGHTAYALDFEPLAHYAYALYWLTFAGLCWLHLRVMGAAHPRLKLAVVVALAATAIGMQTLSGLQAKRGGTAPPRYLGTVQPAFLRAWPAQSFDRFLAEAATLQAELDAARDEEGSTADSEL